MSTYRREWDCCGSVTETDAWEPEHCPFCHEAIIAAPAVANGAVTDEVETRTEQIRRAHASARPKDSNPAWVNSHHDCEKLLSHIALLKGEVSALQAAIAASSATNAQLVAALKELCAMYGSTWDSVDGSLVMMGTGVERFEKAHDAGLAALAAAGVAK